MFSTSVSTTTNQGAQIVYFAFEHTDSSFCSSSFEMLSLVILTLNQCGTKGVNLSGAYWTVRNQERSKSASKCIWRLKVKCLSSQARRQHAVATSQGAMCLSRFGRRSVLDCESRSARCVQASIILSSILFNGWSSQGRRQQHRDKASDVLSFWTKERACCEEYRRIPDSSFCLSGRSKPDGQRTSEEFRLGELICAPDLRTTPRQRLYRQPINRGDGKFVPPVSLQWIDGRGWTKDDASTTSTINKK